MKKLLNALLMLSVMAAVVPAQAVQIRRLRPATGRVDLIEVRDVEVADARNEQEVQNHQNQYTRGKALQEALLAAMVVATGSILIGIYASIVDCDAVAQAYCAGAEIAPDVLQACQQYLPSTLGCWF